MEHFNPGLQNLVALGNSYVKAFQGEWAYDWLGVGTFLGDWMRVCVCVCRNLKVILIILVYTFTFLLISEETHYTFFMFDN